MPISLRQRALHNVVTEEKDCGILRFGEEEFASRFSASSRSLFKRNGISCVSLSASQPSLRDISKSSNSDSPAENRDAVNGLKGSLPFHSRNFQSFKLRQKRERAEMLQRDLEREQQRQMHRAAFLGHDNAVPANPKPPRHSHGECDTHIETCGICCDDQPMEVLVPCGHMLCSECWQCVRGNSCPFCRRFVQQSVMICESASPSGSHDHVARSNPGMTVAVPCGHIICSKPTTFSHIHGATHSCPNCKATVDQSVRVFKP